MAPRVQGIMAESGIICGKFRWRLMPHVPGHERGKALTVLAGPIVHTDWSHEPVRGQLLDASRRAQESIHGNIRPIFLLVSSSCQTV